MKLLQPGRIGNLEIRNRVIMAPMGAHGLHEPDGDWGERFIAYYEARAKGGTGLITTEMVFVTQALEPVAKHQFNPASDKHIASMRKLAARLHACGSKLSIQLTAGFGRVVPPPVLVEGVAPVSASVNTNYYLPEDPELNTRELATEEAAALAAAFGFAAMRCREGGADCVELHGHEGYLMDQFMTGLWNRRTDRYGGSREKRLTFAREAVSAIRAQAGDDFPVIYRFGLAHYLEGGREEEEGLWIARELEKMGVSALHVDAGCYETPWWPHPPMYQQPGFMAHLAGKAKKVVSVPVIAVGRLQYPEKAEQVLAEGMADFIAIGRGLLAEPEWVNKVAGNNIDEMRPCIGCHEGCLWQMIAGEPTSCSLNPECGHETQWKPVPLKKKKPLLVIGGGPAGIEAARVGAARGFDVSLWEASDRLGGNLWPAGAPAFKNDIADYIHYLQTTVRKLPVAVVLNKRATASDVINFNADDVIVATGAVMEPLTFPSASDAKVMTAIGALNGEELEGRKVIVIGGGIMGTETALYLAQQGRAVTIITRRAADQLAVELFDHNNRLMLLRMVQAADITVCADAKPQRLERDGVVVKHEGAEKKISGDGFVFAGRMISVNTLSVELAKSGKKIISIGDCVKPARIMDAVWGAFHAVREL